jgi:hypothetical protein
MWMRCQEVALSRDFPCMNLTIGPPDVAGALAVFPVFGPPPQLEYLSFAEAASLGARVTELPSGASVNDLLVLNPLDLPVLLYEGEELVGAQQDRTVDAAVLVPAGAHFPVAVSCVERNRWDGARHAEPFAPSPRAAFPALRALKNSRIRVGGRADQSEVWAAVDEVAADSPTRAMGDAFDRPEIAELRSAIPRHDGQCGALVAIGGRFVVLDFVSRADVFAALHGPLVSGYALDALHAAPADPPSEPEALLAEIESAPRRADGDRLHFQRGRLSGSSLTHEGELIALSAFVGG